MQIEITEDSKITTGTRHGLKYVAVVHYRPAIRSWHVDVLVHDKSGNIRDSYSRTQDAVQECPFALDAVKETLAEWPEGVAA